MKTFCENSAISARCELRDFGTLHTAAAMLYGAAMLHTAAAMLYGAVMLYQFMAVVSTLRKGA